MGVLEFFGTLIKNDVTSSSIKANFAEKKEINHFFLDFNSIIHVSSQQIIADVNTFLRIILKTLFHKRSMNIPSIVEKFELYRMEDIQKKITPTTDPADVIIMFHEHFDEKYMDKLIITLVINTILRIIKTYCQNKDIRTIMFAIDGVPSKGKMIEQRQRRYLGAITEEYEKKILEKYSDYLSGSEDFIYYAERDGIKWSRNKITPGTAFMQKLVNYLGSDNIIEKFKTNRKKMKVILSDMYEIGEGEKKIVNYINKYLRDTEDTVMVYSPDADMILLCMLLPVKKLYMLRHNKQSDAYDLLDIHMLKNNIGYYINNNPNDPGKDFDVDRISYDIVCISTLFGNDFVPKMETLNVKKGFQNIMDAYFDALMMFGGKKEYLVRVKGSEGSGENKGGSIRDGRISGRESRGSSRESSRRNSRESSREDRGSSREDRGSSRESGASSREDRRSSRESGGSSRKSGGSSREGSRNSREDGEGRRNSRENSGNSRESSGNSRESSGNSRTDRGSNREAGGSNIENRGGNTDKPPTCKTSFCLNLKFLKNVIAALLPEEQDFIKHNDLYAKYVTIGKIKNVFDYVEITSDNLNSVYHEFRQEYDELQQAIRRGENLFRFESNDKFMYSLKKCIVVIIDDQQVNTSSLTNKELLKLIITYYRKYREFPWIDINLNTWSHSISDKKHKNILKEKGYSNNVFQRERYKFEHMLDEYYVKFNAQPLTLTKNKIGDYYTDYFGITVMKNGDLTKDAIMIMHDYLEGMLWVFDYYFNDPSYINYWYYKHEKSPLMGHFLMFLDGINYDYFDNVLKNLDKCHVKNLQNYFSPIEQLIYVSPMTPGVMRLLPSNYKEYLTSDLLDPFLKSYFVDINGIVNKLWRERISTDVDCRGIIFFNKCQIYSIVKPSSSDDKMFLDAIRKVKPNDISIKRGRLLEPEY